MAICSDQQQRLRLYDDELLAEDGRVDRDDMPLLDDEPSSEVVDDMVEDSGERRVTEPASPNASREYRPPRTLNPVASDFSSSA